MNEEKLNMILKLAAIFAIFIVSISISYHFLVYIPKKDKAMIEVQKKEIEIRKRDLLVKKKIEAEVIAGKLRKEFNNVHSVYFDEEQNTFIVVYYEKGKETECRLGDFGAKQ